MTEPSKLPAGAGTIRPGPGPAGHQTGFRRVALATCALVLCFSRPLFDLMRFAIQSDLYSHILLVPVISLYLVWVKRSLLPPPSAPARGIAWALLGAGTFVLAGYWVEVMAGTKLAPEDSLALTTLSFVLFIGGICSWLLGRETLRTIAFPLGFLVFLVPFPVFLEAGIESLLQQGSAAVAFALFRLSGMTVFYHDLVFKLPTISLRVAPECSGIHSTLALFITSLIAGQLFLRTPWKRATLALAVVPIALLRNGLRVFTIGELCVQVSPDMIDSYIHRHGGPVFFILSLVPFFILLRLLYKSDRHSKNALS